MLDDILKSGITDGEYVFIPTETSLACFFKDIPDEELVSYCDAELLTGGMR